EEQRVSLDDRRSRRGRRREVRLLVRLATIAAALCGLAIRAGAEQPPEVNYMIHCMGCHLADGSGSPPQVPDVRGEMGRLLGADGGREYLVQIPGAATAPVSDGEL